MTPPVPEMRSRPVHRDAQDALEVRNIVVAAHLTERGHECLYVRHDSNRKAVFVFKSSAVADFARLNRTTDELASLRERAAASKFGTAHYSLSTQEKNDDHGHRSR